MSLTRFMVILVTAVTGLILMLGCGNGDDCEEYNIVDEYVDQLSRVQLSYLTINADGTYLLDEGGMTTEGTWERDCNTVEFTSDSGRFEGKIEKGMITDDYGREWIGYIEIDSSDMDKYRAK